MSCMARLIKTMYVCKCGRAWNKGDKKPRCNNEDALDMWLHDHRLLKYAPALVVIGYLILLANIAYFGTLVVLHFASKIINYFGM